MVCSLLPPSYWLKINVFMKQEKELRNRIIERVDGAEEFLSKAQKEKKESRRNVLIASACSNMRVALEMFINALYQEENPGGKDTLLYEKIGFLKQHRAISQGQLYKIDRIRSIGNLSVHDAERKISIDQALSCLMDLKEILSFFFPKDGRLLIRKHYALYGVLAFLLFAFIVAVPGLVFFFPEQDKVVFSLSCVVYGLIVLFFLFAYPTKKGFLIYRHPKGKTFLLPFYMALVCAFSFFIFDVLLPERLYLTLSLSFSVSYLILFFVLIHCYNGKEKKEGK